MAQTIVYQITGSIPENSSVNENLIDPILIWGDDSIPYARFNNLFLSGSNTEVAVSSSIKGFDWDNNVTASLSIDSISHSTYSGSIKWVKFNEIDDNNDPVGESSAQWLGATADTKVFKLTDTSTYAHPTRSDANGVALSSLSANDKVMCHVNVLRVQYISDVNVNGEPSTTISVVGDGNGIFVNEVLVVNE